MNRPPSSPPAPRILLVEGADDKHVVRQLFCRRHQSPPDFSIEDKEGIDKLLSSIEVEIKVSGRQTVGILADANDDVANRWKAITDRLSEVDIQPPASPDPAGTIIPGTPRIGIWLMPDNESPGELENFVVQMIPNEDPVWPLSRDYIDGIPREGRKFSAKKELRAQLYAWLAAREDPRRMGLAIGAGDLGIDGDLSQKFVAWLAQLFG